MPFYLGLPIAICLWITVMILSLVVINIFFDLRRSNTSYNNALDKAVKRELAKINKQGNKGDQNAD